MKYAVDSSSRYVAKIPALPLAPTLVTQLLAVFREPDQEVDSVVRLISYEPALTAEILRRCNSACFAGEEPATDIFESVSRLGFYEIYQLVVALFGAGTKTLEGASEGLDVEALWRHSVTTAVAASVISDGIGEVKPAAFTAGLLHDIGKLVLASVERARYAEVVELAKRQNISLVGQERDAFGIDHSELGGELMVLWNMPEEVIAAVRHHHQSAAETGFNRLGAMIELADLVAVDLDCGIDSSVRHSPAAISSLTILGYTEKDFERLARRTEKELEAVQSLLQM